MYKMGMISNKKSGVCIAALLTASVSSLKIPLKSARSRDGGHCLGASIVQMITHYNQALVNDPKIPFDLMWQI